MRAHAISHTNPFIAHLAYVGFTYQFSTPPHPTHEHAHRPVSCTDCTYIFLLFPFIFFLFACGPTAAYFIGHITKDYSNNETTNLPTCSQFPAPSSPVPSSCLPLEVQRYESLCLRGYKNMMSISYILYTIHIHIYISMYIYIYFYNFLLPLCPLDC